MLVAEFRLLSQIVNDDPRHETKMALMRQDILNNLTFSWFFLNVETH